jgi:hypothetical protein
MQQQKRDIFMRTGLGMRIMTSSDCASSRRRLAACLLRKSPLRGDRAGAAPTASGGFAGRNQSSSPLVRLRSLGGSLFAGAARYARQGLCRPWTRALLARTSGDCGGGFASLCSLGFFVSLCLLGFDEKDMSLLVGVGC